MEVLRLVQTVLSAAASARQGSSRGHSCSRLQMDPHYVPVLEGSHALRRQPLREIANHARLASGKRLEPTTSGFCCGNLSTVCESRARQDPSDVYGKPTIRSR